MISHKLAHLSTTETIMLTNEIEEISKMASVLLMGVYKHVKDVDKILECDEVECESFHLSRHCSIYRQIDEVLIHFLNLKLKIKNSLERSLYSV